MLSSLFEMPIKIDIVKKNETIDLHELPIGKYPFIGSVSKTSFDNNTDAGKQTQYLYLEKLKIKIDNTWRDVECSYNAVKIKMGKKLKRLHLKKNNIITFNAQVVSKDIEFDKVEGLGKLKPKRQYCEPHAVLPKSYKGKITVYLYKDITSEHYSCWHNNYMESYRKDIFECHYVTDFNWQPQDTKYKYHIKPRSMFYEGRELKHLSNIVSLKVEKGGKK